MERVAAQSDSDPDNNWECKAGYYVCFQDCCQRIHQFCNVDEKRCQLCSTQSIYCGNDSLPVHCDAWCLQQKYSHNTAPTECVSPAYFWSTYILLSIVVVLGIITFIIYRRNKDCHTNKDPKCIDSDSSTDSLQLLQETQQKQCNEELLLIDHSDGGKHTTDKKEQDADFDNAVNSNTKEEAESSSKQCISSRNTVFHNISPTSVDTHPVSIHTGFTSTPNVNLYSNI